MLQVGVVSKLHVGVVGKLHVGVVGKLSFILCHLLATF